MALFLYLVVATACAAICVRRQWASRWAALVLLLLPLLITGRALFTNGVYGPVDLAYTTEPLASLSDRMGVGHVANPNTTDLYAQFMPWRAAVRYAVAHHQWPLWEPFELSGTVLAEAVQSGPYHPFNLLALFIAEPLAITFVAAIAFFAAAMTTFLLVRDQGLGETAALICAAGWIFATHLMAFMGTAHGLALATMPLALLGARRIAISPGTTSTALLTGSLVLVILAGHPESILYTLLLAVPYFAVELWLARGAAWRRAVASGLVSGALALLLSAIALVPLFGALPQTEELSFRRSGYVAGHAAVGAASIRHQLLASVLPFVDGVANVEVPRHEHELIHHFLGSTDTGSLLIALALCALIWRRDARVWFFAVVALLGTLAGTGLLNAAAAAVPLLNITIVERMIWMGAFAVVVLAGHGVDALRLHERQGAAFMAAVTLAFASAAIVLTPSLVAQGLSRDFLVTGAARTVAPLLLAAVALLMFADPRRYAGVLLVLVVIQRAGQTDALRMLTPRAAFYPPFAGLELLKPAEPFRIVGLHGILPPATAAHYGLEDARGFSSMTLARTGATLGLWSVRQPVWSNRVDTLDSPFLSLMNVRFAIVQPDTVLPGWWKVRMKAAGYWIAENERVLPRAFVPELVHTGVSQSAAIRAVSSASDFRRDAWIESGRQLTSLNGPGSAVVKRDGTKLDMHVSMHNGGWVVVSQTAWRGWRAVTRGREIPLRVANGTFLAFYLPAGTHHVKMFYRPASFIVGSGISAMTAVALMAFTIARRRNHRVPEI